LQKEKFHNHVKLNVIVALYIMADSEFPNTPYRCHIPLRNQHFLVVVKSIIHMSPYAIKIELDVGCPGSMELLTSAK